MFVFLYSIILFVLVYFGWLVWGENILYNVIIFSFIYVLFFILRLVICRISCPQPPKQSEAAGIAGAFFDGLLDLPYIGEVLGDLCDSTINNKKLSAYQAQIDRHFKIFMLSIIFSFISTISIAIYAYTKT